MSVAELRRLAVMIDSALEVFQPYAVEALTADETRARLSLAAAARQVSSALHEKMSAQLEEVRAKRDPRTAPDKSDKKVPAAKSAGRPRSK